MPSTTVKFSERRFKLHVKHCPINVFERDATNFAKNLIPKLVHLTKSPNLNLIENLCSMLIDHRNLKGPNKHLRFSKSIKKGWNQVHEKLPKIQISQIFNHDRPRWGTDSTLFRCAELPLSCHISVESKQCFLAVMCLVRNILRTLYFVQK
jgi:hypothetical protein